MSNMSNSNFPAWMYSPDGDAKIFERDEDVPKGWLDHPIKVEEGENDGVATASTDDEKLIVENVNEDATSPVEPSKKSKKKVK